MTQRGAAVVGLTPAPRCVLSGLCPCLRSLLCAPVPLWSVVSWRVDKTGTITDALFCDNGHDSVLHVQYP